MAEPTGDPFNIAVFGDTHLDYAAHGHTDGNGMNLRALDGERAFNEIFTGILDSSTPVNAIVHTGDVFHTPMPSIRSIRFVNHYARLASERGIPLYIDSGNHDTPDQKHKMSAVSVLDHPQIGIHGLYKPYEVKMIADGIALHSVGHHGLKGSQAPEVKAVDGVLNLFMAHGAALDPKNATLMSCKDSPREQIIPVEMVINEDFVMKMLGHYHSRYAVGSELLNTWYTGSTLRRGFSDESGSRGWMLISIYPNGTATKKFHNIYQRPQYDLSVIDAAGLTAPQLQERIEQNMLTTRRDEAIGEFNPNEAPIVRQKVINAPLSLRAGVDRSRIGQLSQHMLHWDLSYSAPERTARSASDEKKGDDVSLARSGANRTGTLDYFKQWSDESEALKGMTEKQKEAVKKKAVAHLESVRTGKEG